jgi:hypothetical protein
MRSQLRLAACLFALALLPRPAGSLITVDGGGDTGSGGGGGGGGGSTSTGDPSDPPPDGTPIFDPRHDHVHDFELRGYTCSAGNFAEVECRQCFPQSDGTQICDDTFCNADHCDGGRSRDGIPQAIDPARYTLWAVGFAPGASSYWLGDFDGDGRRDLGAQLGGTVEAALSQGTHFEDDGAWAGPAPVESAGPTATLDVNGDGVPDTLSISPARHLQIAVSSTSGATSVVELADTWCASGDCLIADVNGDGLPDLVDVARTTANNGLQAGDVWVSLGSPLPDFPALAPPAPTDTDGDGVRDGVDDCTNVADPAQLDSDGDGIGNACDADLNEDGTVNAADQTLWLTCLGAIVDQRPECAASDFDGDGLVTVNDFRNVLQPSMNHPPGPSAVDQRPAIDLAVPADGTIDSPAMRMTWVAGWIPNMPEGDVQVLVNGQPVAVSGATNFFSTFLDLSLPAGDPRMFHAISVEALAGGKRSIARRVVLVGDHVAPGGLAHDALGAAFEAHGLARIVDYLNATLSPKIQTDFVGSLNGSVYDYGCATVSVFVSPICWTGYDIENARIDSPPVITAEFQDGGALHVHASISALHFDWRVHVEGPDCGDDANFTNIQIDLRYKLQVGSDGHIQVVELADPVVTTDPPDIDGCWGFNGTIGDRTKSKIFDFVDQTQDTTIFSYAKKGPVAEAVENVLNSVDASGALVTKISGADVALDYRAQFESVAQDASGMIAWLGAGLAAATADPSFGGPDGAYQLPYRTAPTAMPTALPNGASFDVAAAVTPNGLNAALDALTRQGAIDKQKFDVTQVVLFAGTKPRPITAEVLKTFVPEFAAKYKLKDQFIVRVTPGAVAPVVSGLHGPGDEEVDLQAPQVQVDFVDPAGKVPLSVRFDARIGVIPGLAATGDGSLTAFANQLEVEDFAVMENTLGADPAEIASGILCVGVEVTGSSSCALGGTILDGLGTSLAAITLPSIANIAGGFALAPKCLVPLDDGTLVGEFGLILPGEPLPQSSPLGNVTANWECESGVLAVDPGGGVSVDPVPTDPPASDPGSGGSPSGGGGTSSGGGIGGGGAGPSPDDPPLHQL